MFLGMSSEFTRKDFGVSSGSTAAQRLCLWGVFALGQGLLTLGLSGIGMGSAHLEMNLVLLPPALPGVLDWYLGVGTATAPSGELSRISKAIWLLFSSQGMTCPSLPARSPCSTAPHLCLG